MPRVVTGIPNAGDRLGGAQRSNLPQPRGAARRPRAVRPAATTRRPRAVRPAATTRNAPTFAGGLGSRGALRGQPAPARIDSILGQYLGGASTGIGVSRRNLGLSLDSAERSRVAANRISGITRDADLRATLGSASLRRDFLGQDIGQRRSFLSEDIDSRREFLGRETDLLGRLRATEDRVGFRRHLSSVAGLAQGVQQRLRTDLVAGRALRDEQDRITTDRTRSDIDRAESQGSRDIDRTESQARREIALTETRARDRHGTSGEIQTIRDDLASADIAQRRSVGEANLADRESEQSFSIGNLPVYDFFGG